MYPNVQFLEGKLVTVGGITVATKAHTKTTKLALFSLRYHLEVDSQALVVGFEVASEPSQTFQWGN